MDKKIYINKRFRFLILFIVFFLVSLPIILADSPIPNWYKGDQHVHTAFGGLL